LAELRTRLRGTHVVVRTRQDIVCVPLLENAEVVGTPTSFVTRDNQHLAMKLVRDALRRAVLNWGYKLGRNAPITFVSRHPNKDLLAPLLQAHGPDALRRVHVYPKFLLD